MFNCDFKRMLILVCIICLNTRASNIEIIDQSINDITIEITIEELLHAKQKLNNKLFDIISIKGFGKSCSEGFPDLPYKGITVATRVKSNFKISILESEYKILNDFTLAPGQGPDVIAPNDHLIKKGFLQNSEFYNVDAYHPKLPAIVQKQGAVQDINLVTVGIYPIQYNPIKKTLKHFKKIRVKFEFNSPVQRSLSTSKSKLLTNITFNNKNFYIREKRSRPQSILIITKDIFSEATEKLVEWQRQKGYHVTVDSRNIWTPYEIQNAIENWYDIDSIDASYLLLIGDLEDIPSHGTLTKTAYSTYTGPTDHFYSCIGEDDYYSEMARGRIPASTAEEALNAVNKIIRFEKKPPFLESYYKKTLGAAYLQDNDKNEWWPENAYGYADRRFAQTIEEINLYLENKGYSFDRVFNTNASVVNKWNLGKYSWGEPVPDYLKPPQFNWDGKTEDILNTLNKGAFLAYHYDHGMQEGWADPEFTVNDIPSLTNDSILPIIYSINCLTGKFNHDSMCFAEKMICDERIGAAGVIAATNLSYSGWNEAFLLGMIDATWPGISLSTPNTENPIVTNHEPIYKIGDIMNQGLFRMTETWTNTYSEDYDKYHFQLYHYFGDPTTRIWTKIPEVLSPSHSMTINPNDINFLININEIKEGILTLYDKNKCIVVGRSFSEGDKSSIVLPDDLEIGDTLLLTITGQDVRPYQKNIIVTNDITNIDNFTHSSMHNITMNGSKLTFKQQRYKKMYLNIFDYKGRLILKKDLKMFKKGIVDLNKFKFSNGNYFLKVDGDNLKFTTKFTILN